MHVTSCVGSETLSRLVEVVASLFCVQFNLIITPLTIVWFSIVMAPKMIILLHEPVHDKTNNLGFRPGPTQTGLYKHRRWLEA